MDLAQDYIELLVYHIQHVCIDLSGGLVCMSNKELPGYIGITDSYLPWDI